MIYRHRLMFSITAFILINGYYVSGYQTAINQLNNSKLNFPKMQHNLSQISHFRTERGILSGEEHEEYKWPIHSYHEHIPPQYVIKLVAPRKHSKDTGVSELLLILAPLTAIPLIGSLALTTFTALFASGAYGKRRKRNINAQSTNLPEIGEEKREIQELDIIQKYLNKMGRPDYNDEIIATYLSCNGMLALNNHCLERLTCQFSDSTSGLKQLEREVSSLVIYSILKNDHVDNEFKSRLQRAALFGRDSPGRCNFYNCPKINDSHKKAKLRT